MARKFGLAFIAACFANAAFAQMPSPIAAPLVESSVTVAPGVASNSSKLALPASTEVVLALDEELSTKISKAGDTFRMTVVRDVVYKGYLVIPKGARAVGEVTMRTGKGAYGKSAKMEIEPRYVDLGSTRVLLDGSLRQVGDSNAVNLMTGIALAGVFSGVITGKTSIIPRGRELVVYTREAVPIGDSLYIGSPKPVAAPNPETTIGPDKL
jgi:hypothetical protein